MVPDLVTAYLAGAGIGLTEATNLFDSDVPAAAPGEVGSDCVVVMEAGGAKPDRTMGTTLASRVARNVRVKVMVRGAYSWSRTMLEAILDKLPYAAGFASGGQTILWCTQAEEPRSRGTDTADRLVFECQFDMKVRG